METGEAVVTRDKKMFVVVVVMVVLFEKYSYLDRAENCKYFYKRYENNFW